MNNFFQLSEKDRIDVVNQAVIRKKLPAEAIEKDIWVTAVLRALFSLPYADSISFKGGTSLSKCFNLIERFSEDVDIAINREYFGFWGEKFTIKQISKELRKACCGFCRNTLQFDLAKKLVADGIPENLFSVSMNITSITTVDPEKIFIAYQSLFSDNKPDNTDSYIQSVVVLEINARSMKEPLENVELRSIIDETFSDKTFADKPFAVSAVVPERTFLEKVCLLHEEFSKPRESVRVERMSRHLYDIVRIMETPIAEKTLKDKDLFGSIVAHRRLFIAMKDFNYDTLAPQMLKIVPPDSVFSKWESDYGKMQTIIYGETLSFSVLIEKVKELNQRLNSISW
ncbi:MAG: nucleotidyl transferase AbiEii/AbiGii toxin family protein [Prevotellaceae bacterium]|jgi:hypothetical protein|nr:nucleotidyl transferase AbiEii/AbiGii toxin family protein [Prevotellaceae bacterium]